MKRQSFYTSVIVTFALFLGGCCTVPQEALTQASDNALICDGFVQLMENGKTSREQEQDFIRENRRAWHAQNFALNDVPLPTDIAPVNSSRGE